MNDELIPLNTEDMGPKVKEFLEALRKKVKGQDMALRDIATAYEYYISGVKKKDKPIFCGLFLGPSGVGKTLVSEILAEHLFGSRDAFCKVNCEELKQSHQMASLIGSPPGYIGFQDPNDQERFSLDSSHPMLSQWNLDKHDADRLRKQNMAERKKFVDRKKQHDAGEGLKGMREEITRLQEQITKTEIEIASLEKKLLALPKKGKKANERWDLGAKINKLQAYLSSLKQQQNEMTKALQEASKAHAAEGESLRSWYKSMVERGVHYDPDAGTYPYTSIVLFDEIEKADESLFHLLFEVMDKGQLQLANGMTTSFRNTFLFMSGNIGEMEIADIMSGNAKLGFNQGDSGDAFEVNEKIYKAAVEAAKEKFPPAFLGRLDKIVVFRPLKFDTLIDILDVHVAELMKDLLDSKKPILIELEKPVKEYLVKQSMEGGRNAYGARNLKSRLHKYITSKLIRALGNESLKPPADVIVKLAKVNGKEKVVLYERPIQFPEIVVKDKTNH